MLKIANKEKFPFGPGARCVYAIESPFDRQAAIQFALNAFEKIPLTERNMHIDDGLTADEGTMATDFRQIVSADWFIGQYLRSPIDHIIILGKYKGKKMHVAVHLNKAKIVIAGTDPDLIEEIEKTLELKNG